MLYLEVIWLTQHSGVFLMAVSKTYMGTRAALMDKISNSKYRPRTSMAGTEEVNVTSDGWITAGDTVPLCIDIY